MGGGSRVASADAVQDLEGGVGNDLLRSACDCETVSDHGEELLAGFGAELVGRDDSSWVWIPHDDAEPLNSKGLREGQEAKGLLLG